ncbi:MAG: helix-turn-helix domain-containing protein [Pirellulaceae bacterium]
MLDSSTLLTVRELAERLRVSLATAYALLKQGKIPPIRVGARGGGLRVRVSDVERFLAAMTGAVAATEAAAKPARVRLKHLKLK